MFKECHINLQLITVMSQGASTILVIIDSLKLIGKCFLQVQLGTGLEPLQN